MTLKERLQQLRPATRLKPLPLENGATVYLPRLSLADWFEIHEADAESADVLRVMVRDEAGERVFGEADNVADIFTSEDAKAIITACYALNGVEQDAPASKDAPEATEGQAEGESPRPNPQ